MEEFDKKATLLKKMIGETRHISITQLGDGQWSCAVVNNEAQDGEVVAEAAGDKFDVCLNQCFDLCVEMFKSGNLKKA